MQTIFKGKTDRCLPSREVRNDLKRRGLRGFDFAYSPNHWSNPATMNQWADEILAPYIAGVKARYCFVLCI
jgi:hypothetical protein